MLRLPTIESEKSMSSRTFWLNGLTGAVLTLGALGAQAGPVMTLNTQVGGDRSDVVWKDGAGSHSYDGTGGGGYVGTLTNAGFHNQNPLLAYCVELTQTFTLGHAYNSDEYTVVDAASFLGNNQKETRLANLFTWALGNSSSWFSEKNKSSGIQLAVWEIIYDTDLSLSDTSGNFYAGVNTNAAALDYANTLLTHADTSQSNPLNILFLKAANNQDQLFWEDDHGHQSTVPEPMSLALTAVALAGLALTRRRG